MLLFKRKPKRQKKTPQRGTVDYNAYKMRKKYPLSKNGYFGERGQGRSRVVYSDEHEKEAKHFYEKMGKYGKRKPLPNGHGEQKIMKDGGLVIYRKKTSTPNSPAVNFGKMKGKVKNQKIHFVKMRKNNGK